MKIYTKTGDKGLTGLIHGERIYKDNIRIELYGEVDELNSSLGIVCAFMKLEDIFTDEIIFLANVQSVLFDLGSLLACEAKFRASFKLPSISNDIITNIEASIDRMDGNLPVLKNFILPGGTIIASQLHLSRCICRRVERKLISFSIKSPDEVPNHSIELLNRMSDYLFVLARHANFVKSCPEINWNKK